MLEIAQKINSQLSTLRRLIKAQTKGTRSKNSRYPGSSPEKQATKVTLSADESTVKTFETELLKVCILVNEDLFEQMSLAVQLLAQQAKKCDLRQFIKSRNSRRQHNYRGLSKRRCLAANSP